MASARVGLLFATVLTLAACERDASVAPSKLAFPSEQSGRLEITYPLDETLFQPDIVAPTLTWSDDTSGVEQWQVLLRFGSNDELLCFDTTEPQWRLSEEDC